MNRLCGTRSYLVGAMDRVADGGVGWRETISAFLKERGVVVFNPCKKHEILDSGFENIEDRDRRKNQKIARAYDRIAEDMKQIRITDLRMVDIVDFLIVNLDIDVHACGSYEEIATANRQKKPILIHMEQGKQHAPDWLFGMVPHEHIFTDWECLHDYLDEVDSGKDTKSYKRWLFFDLAEPTLVSLLKAAGHDKELKQMIMDWVDDQDPLKEYL